MFFPDAADEIVQLAQNALRRRNHERAVATADPAVAETTVALATTYPWMPPGALHSLGQARKTPDAPESVELARRAAVALLRAPFGFRSPGDRVKGVELAGKEYDPARLADAVSQREAAFDVTGQRERFRQTQGFLPEVDRVEAAQRELDAVTKELQAQGRSPEEINDDPRYREALDRWRELRGGTPAERVFAPERATELVAGAERAGAITASHEGARAAVRGLTMAMDAPLREGQGLFRNIVATGEEIASGEAPDFGRFLESQSELGTAIDLLLEGEPVETGHGFLVNPESPLAQETRRRQLERGNIAGHVITPGRWVADQVFEPGSVPFNVLSGALDLGVAVKADPSALALGKAGAVQAARKTIRPDQVESWLVGPAGRKVVDYLATEKNWDAVWRRTNKKLPVELVTRLTDADSADEVMDILRGPDALGTAVREWPKLKRFRPAREVRLLGHMPSPRIDLDDVDDAVEQVDRYLRNAKIPTERISKLTERMARATGDRHEQYRVIMDTVNEVNDALRAAGVPDTQIKRLSKLWVDAHEGNRLYFVDELGHNVDFPGAVVAGAMGPKPQPHLMVEVVGRFIPLPDLKSVRGIRRATSPYTKLLAKSENVADLRLPFAAAEFLTNDLWKPSVLMRLAYPVRVVGEEQFRMAAAGLNSMFNHPLSYIAYAVGRKSGTDVLGTAWDDIADFRNALTREGGGWHDPTGAHRSRHWDPIARGEEEYTPALADELGQLHADPIAQRILQSGADDTKAWFRTGDGAKVRLQMAKTNKALSDARNSDAYIDSVVERIRIKSGGDTRLMEAIQTGKLAGVRLSDDGATLNRKFVHELQKVVDEGVGPEHVKGQVVDYFRTGAAAEKWNRAVETMFTYLMGKPTNWLSRSPTFQQYYWRRLEELHPYLDDAARANLASGAKRAKIKFNPAKGDAATRIGLDEADILAKGHALDETRNLLYSLAERSQFFDATRIVFPFGEAWKEMFTRWGQLAVERPQTGRRLQQGIEVARDTGFFQTDPVTGDEIFVYPGTAWLNEQLLGVPVPLTGRVQGLSLMTEVLPGLGPAVQLPVGFLFDQPFLDKPEWDWLKELALPFGEVTTPSDLRNWAPAWLEKFITGAMPTGEQRRLLANTTADFATWLASTGKYDLHGASAEEEMDRLWRDAKRKAKHMYFIRGVAQLGAPSAPTPQMVVKDKNGNVQILAILRKEYIEAVQKADGDSDKATAAFLNKYGEDAFLVMQSKSYGVVFGVPTSGEGLDWMRNNKDLERRFPNTFGYFAPLGDPDDFSYEAYIRQFEQKQRHPLTVEQYTKLGQARVAGFLYRRAQEKAGPSPTDAQRDWLRQYKAALRAEYPGFDEIETLGLPARPKKEQILRELYRAAKDPKVLATPAGGALAKYLKARTRAAEAGNTPTSFISSNSMRPVRDWLRQVGSTIARETPEFSSLWDSVLEDEMEDDTEEE